MVLPAWLSWSDLTEMKGVEGMDRDMLARVFARSLNGQERYEDETVANAERQVGLAVVVCVVCVCVCVLFVCVCVLFVC